MQAREFVNKVKQEALLANDRDTFEVIQAVFWTLHQRIPEGEADDVAATLPTEIKDIWNGTIAQRLAKKMGVVERFGKQQFVNKVQNLARLSSIEEAEKKSKAVLHVLKEAIPKGETEDLAAELPSDLRQFLLDA